MLLSRGADVPMETLGLEAVLIDILTGTINPFAEGELLISVFAMNRVAKIHGKEFAGVRYSFDDLKALYQNACPAGGECAIRVIARVGEDHFVVVTKVMDTEVACFETGKGKDGEAVTMTRDAFVKVWKAEESGKGYLVVDAKDSTAMSRLSDEEAQRIRGSFWPFVFLIVSLVLTVASIAVSSFSPTLGKILGYAAMVAGIVSIVASVGSWVVSGVKMVYSSIAQNGLFQTVWQGLQGVGNFLMQTVESAGRFFQSGFQFLKGGFSGGFSSLGSGITNTIDFVMNPAGTKVLADGVTVKVFTAGQAVARNLIAVGINMGVTQGLSGLGLDPSLANLAGAFTGFGAIGLGSGLSGFIKSGLQGMMLIGVSEMGLKLNLPPPIAGVLSVTASAALGACFDPALTLKAAITEIAPAVSSQFVLGGMDLLRRSLGMDPRIMRLIGLPISAAIGAITGQALGLNGYQDVFGSIKNAMLSSLVSVGSSIALDAIGAPAALQSFVPGLLSQLIVSAGGAGSADAQEQGEGIFDKIVDGISKFGSGLVGGIQNAISFGAKVLEQGAGFIKEGFAKAVDLFANFFDRHAQETIMNAGGGSIENAILNSDFLNLGSGLYQSTVHFGGEVVTLDLDTVFDKLEYRCGDVSATAVGLNLMGELFEGSIAFAEEIGDGVILQEAYDDGKLEMLSTAKDGSDMIRIDALSGQGIEFERDGNLKSGVFNSSATGLDYTVDDGEIYSLNIARNGMNGLAYDLNEDEKFLLKLTIDPLTKQARVVYDLGSKVLGDLVSQGIVPPLLQWGEDTGEKMCNYLMGFDFRTNDEITQAREEKIVAAHAIAQDGDLIFGNGETAIDYVIKSGDRNFAEFGTGAPGESRGAGAFVNHVGVIITDPNTHEKYVLETNPGGFRYTKLDDFIARYRDFEINRPKAELNASDAAGYLYQYVDSGTGEAKAGAPSYDYLGLLGLRGDEATSEHPKRLFCSSAVYNAFFNTRKGRDTVLPGVEADFRISPQDIWKAREEWDESLVEIYKREHQQ